MKARSTPARAPAITPEILLRAYAAGVFPMAESADDPGLFWVEPDIRGIIPLDAFHLPGRLARTVRSDRFEIRIDHDFAPRDRGLCRKSAGPGRDLDQRPHPGALWRALPSRLCPHRRMLARGQAGRRALWPVAGRCLLRRKHVPSRDRRFEGGAGASRRPAAARRLPAARHPVPDRASLPVRHARNPARGLSRIARRRGRGSMAIGGVGRLDRRSVAAKRSRSSPTDTIRPLVRPSPSARAPRARSGCRRGRGCGRSGRPPNPIPAGSRRRFRLRAARPSSHRDHRRGN
jgi:hypothetical protein